MVQVKKAEMRQTIIDVATDEFMKKATKDLYRKIDQLPAIAFEKMGVGEFVNRLVQDPSQVLQLLRKLIMLFLRSIIAIVVIVVSFSMSFILGIEILVFAGITALLSYKIFPKIKNLQILLLLEY